MRISPRYLSVTMFTWALSMAVWQPAHAHLMVAQHGTLNVVDDGVFMVLSLPISAFDGIDDDSNGDISMMEFNNHRRDIVESVRQHVTLSDKQGSAALQGIMLSPVALHDSSGESLSQITVMGRFTVDNAISDLRFHIGLYGRQATEQSLEITATRALDRQKSIFELTPVTPESEVFSGIAQPQNKPVVWPL
jgi:hypothetical protein